jgi:hypothetical protein
VNTADLLVKVRLDSMTEDAATDYPDAVLIDELNAALTQKFEQLVIDSLSGYWMQYQDYPLTVGQIGIRVPSRAIKFSKLEIGVGSGTSTQWYAFPELSEAHMGVFQVPLNMVNAPMRYVLRGDQVQFVPPPDSTNYTVRVWYFIRPSKLVPPQNNDPVTGGTDRGRITAINTAARTLTVNAIPFDQSLSAPAAITTATQKIDVVHRDGWHELAIVSATQTIGGSVITLTDTQDMSEIVLGDYVRAEMQTDWPVLPDDFHRALAGVTAMKVLIQQDYQAKAVSVASDVGGDLGRFTSTITKRVQEEPIVLRPYIPTLRGWRG